MSNRAIFLDRDGVINHNRSDYVKTWTEFEFLPGALDALRALATLDVPTIVLSNQSAIGRRLTTLEAVQDINARMMEAIRAAGGRVDEVLFCPHRPDEHCGCRKPQPGLLLEAAQRYSLDLSSCYLVGDAVTDMQAARAVGCRAVMVLTGRGIQQAALLREAELHSCTVAKDLAAAVVWLRERLGNPFLESNPNAKATSALARAGR